MFELMSTVEFYFSDVFITGDVFNAVSFSDILYTICVGATSGRLQFTLSKFDVKFH